MSRPLVIDLFCGLGGWAEGFLEENFDVIGFDIERRPYPGQLVIQDARTLHGSQLRRAAGIVASPPCQEYSSRGMPWSRRAESLHSQISQWADDGGPIHKYKALPTIDNSLFRLCFRLQEEASEAAGHRIPLIVENVKAAQRWVGSAAWHFGSYYLWGDVPAVMPYTQPAKNPGQNWNDYRKKGTTSPHWRMQAGLKIGDQNTHRKDGTTSPHFTNGKEGRKGRGKTWFGKSHGRDFDQKEQNARDSIAEGIKQHGSGREWFDVGIAAVSSESDARKQASAEIAKIPLELAQHIARCFYPR